MLKLNKNKKGFTLVEFLVVLGIFVILMGITLSFFVNFRDEQAITKDASLIIEILREAKNLTLNSKDSNQYGVYFGNEDITLFTGGVYVVGNSSNKIYDLNPSLTISSIILNGGGSSVVFQKLTGETVQNGTITLTTKNLSESRNIVIHKTGLIE